MDNGLSSEAERMADSASALPAFSGVNLAHIKRQMATLLGLIGRDGIFDEYTRHDISHIDTLLKTVDWLIPETTKSIMSPADWLLLVLAIYFHDLGMLVTKEEYNNRNASEFPNYRDQVLFEGEFGADYRSKVERLPHDDAERFLYQEFIRHKHAERVRNWVTGRPTEHLGVSHAAFDEVESLLKPLHPLFRRDLALVCESHHLEDLNDFQKYIVSQPYGDSDAQTANVHFAAILLRTADLLHITNDRTPSAVFRIINPTDPVSQLEWAKQAAVTAVRAQLGRDKDGIPSPDAPQDTVEVFAYFTDEDGFFGLTSYLSYADDQIRKSHDWIQLAVRQHGSRHEFPWRRIDDSNIETEGFIRNTYEFTVDQPRILDLLTGHTLYNDTRVVLRELVQNSLDAVRLQGQLDRRNSAIGHPGQVRIHWDTEERVLSVWDNGTGMTQEIIERHLLKVGASRYQDEDFRRENPDFSPISRFGIGVLSTFMIADDVEIITCHPDEGQARQLSLRGVHGKYLIRLLDKSTDEDAIGLFPHGTMVKLKLRQSAELDDVVATAETWVMIPGCDVSVTIDDGQPIAIGHLSCKEALENILIRHGAEKTSESLTLDGVPIRIEQKETQDVQLSFASRWSDFFRQWEFVNVGALRRTPDDPPIQLGTCVEGVRVEFNTPGYDGNSVLAVANATGLRAPKTNVARSGIEGTPERAVLLQAIYSMYCEHVGEEIQKLHEERQFSLTWATQESTYLLSPLLNSDQRTLLGRRETNVRPLHRELLVEETRHLPVVLLEHKAPRRAISPVQLAEERFVWTIDCALFRSAEYFIREIPGTATLSGALSSIGAAGVELPDEPMVCGCNRGAYNDLSPLHGREVDQIIINHDQRRLDLRWTRQLNKPRWQSARTSPGLAGSGGYEIMVADNDVEVVNLSDEVAVRAFGVVYIPAESPLCSFMLKVLGCRMREISAPEDAAILSVVGFVGQLLGSGSGRRINLSEAEFERYMEANSAPGVPDGRFLDILSGVGLDASEILGAINNIDWDHVFDPSAWIRGGSN